MSGKNLYDFGAIEAVRDLLTARGLLDLSGRSGLMSFTTGLRRGLALAAIPAIAGLVILATSAPLRSAQASARSSVLAAEPRLHITGKIALGSASGYNADVFTEEPSGAVFYSRGSVVYVVDGDSAPAVAIHAAKTVIALAASSSDLFVETGLTVTEYSRSNGRNLRHWQLSSPFTPVTSAGLFVNGSTLWSWTDWFTDESGLEYATVSRIRTNSSAVHEIVNQQAYPANMDANSAGLYFNFVGKDQATFYLAHAEPSGSIHLRREANENAYGALTLSGGRVVQLSVDNKGHSYVDISSATTLARLTSFRVSDDDAEMVGTGAGLLVLKQPCAGGTCSSATVSKLSISTGSVTGTLGVPYARALLRGRSAAVITVTGGHMYLLRIAA